MPIFSHFPSLLLPLLIILSSFTTPSSSSSSSTETFIFGGCSQVKFPPGSAYESSVNSLLNSLVNNAMFSSYKNFTIPPSSPQDTPLYGLYQCRGDLSSPDCSRCVTQAVSQLGTICFDSCGGALQLDDCFVKYDNSTFLGVEDKTLVMKKCGPSTELTSDALTRRDALLAYLETSDGTYKTFRGTISGDLQGVAQCVGDLSATQCQDCLSNAIGQLREECGPAQWGKIYLAKCYARYSEGGHYSRGENDHNNQDNNEFQKTLAIIVVLIGGVALLVIFITYVTKVLKKDRECK